MSNPIRDAEKRTLRYWTEDGLPDLYIGLGFIIYAALTWWSARSNLGWVEALKSIFLVAMIALGRFVVETFKMRLTYPRTGYVAYSQPTRRQAVLSILLSLFVGGVLAFIIFYTLATEGESTGMTLANILLPILFSGMIAVIAYKQGSVRYGIYALIAVLSGLAVLPFARSLPPASQDAVRNGAAMLAVTGAGMLIGGALTLVRYLSRYPLPQEGEA
ncbi:MAG TPA: hypothetical protein VNK49_03735 [Anaerolineales bacterium]|nr:hypothetical protein [Anaerolineales bacterium]